MRIETIFPDDARRASVERFIEEVYQRRFQAQPAQYPPKLVAQFLTGGQVICAAGIREQADGYFSEYYLPSSIDVILSDHTSCAIGRDRVFEVTTLAGNVCGAATHFIEDIVNSGFDQGFEWAFFTATRRLAMLLRRIGIDLVPLAKADRSRVPGPHAWGTYYDQNPEVFAVKRPAAYVRLNSICSERTHV